MKLAVQAGTIIAVRLMLPNLAWMLFHSVEAGARRDLPFALSAAENVVRSAALGL